VKANFSADLQNDEVDDDGHQNPPEAGAPNHHQQAVEEKGHEQDIDSRNDTILKLQELKIGDRFEEIFHFSASTNPAVGQLRLNG
jgi:hypothetical protein